ncbi:glycine-rich protein 3-like [Palaemon carinicauda]|uniref:glycine-rich protein 3-like n=1 Tax=Palaemon carinicauda TaxID=392227 RepID=UPI0035B588D8
MKFVSLVLSLLLVVSAILTPTFASPAPEPEPIFKLLKKFGKKLGGFGGHGHGFGYGYGGGFHHPIPVPVGYGGFHGGFHHGFGGYGHGW